jgi:signal transduction histidine kinase
MFFNSFYTRIIFILTTMSLLLFSLLALVNMVLFRNEFVELLEELERPRVERIFRELDTAFPQNASATQIYAKLDSMAIEFSLELYDSTGTWITGIYPLEQKMLVGEPSYKLNEEVKFAGFARIFCNPNPRSPIHAIKLKVIIKDAPIMRQVFVNFLISGIFVILVSALVGWKLVAYLNRRLDRLKTGVSQVARGDFDVQLPDEGKDEIAFLAKHFNRMSRRIHKLVERLEESNAARQRLFAHASHEIKSPLTSIKGFIDIVEFMNILNEDQQKHLIPLVKKDLNRVVKITNDMLQLTKIRDPGYQLVFKQINLVEFLQEEHDYFGHRAAASGVRAEFDCEEKKLPLLTDPERLSQIVDNLWSNALKYGDPSQPIQTRVFQKGNRVGIQISNHLRHKIDIPLERLFEPFFRNPGPTDQVSGSGLGLAIVKELTQKLGGEIITRLRENELDMILYFPLVKP